MINKQSVAKNWKVLSAVIFLTVTLAVGSGYFQGVIASADSSQQTGNDGTVGTAPISSQVVGGPTATLHQAFNFAHSTFVQAGVGLRNVGSGTISIHVPTGAVITKAFLYWTMMDSGTATTPTTGGLALAYLDGEKVSGTRIATGASPCWGSPNIYVYRGDVTATLVRRGGPIGDQEVTVVSPIVNATSPWTTVATQQAESAHLIVVYSDPSEPTLTTTRIFDATGSPGTITFFGGPASFTAPFASPHSGIARVGYAVADGQAFSAPQPDSKSFKWTSNPSNVTTTLNAGNMYGKDPSLTSKAAFQGSLSDTEEYDVTSNTSAGDTSGTLNWNFGNDCLTTVYAAVQG